MSTYATLHSQLSSTLSEHEQLIGTILTRLKVAIATYPLRTDRQSNPEASVLHSPFNFEGTPMTEEIGDFHDPGAQLMSLDEIVHAQGQTLEYILNVLDRLELPEDHPPEE